MTIQQLQYILEVHRTGSISKAANNLYLAQPNLSNAIRSLEQELGFPVFIRSNKGIRPTEQGLLVLEEAGLRAEMDRRSEKIGYKIREARLAKVPYMVVVGAKEEEEGLVSVRSRFAGDEGQKDLAGFIADLQEEIKTRTAREVTVQEEEKK